MKRREPDLSLKRKNVKIVDLPIDKCFPMPELKREFYDDEYYQKIKKSIASEGLKACYPIMVRPSDGKYETYAGIHRLMAAKEIGRFTNIPAIVNIDIDREQALAIGINDNNLHAPLNPIDFAREMKLWGEKQAEKESRAFPSERGRGRPKSVGLSEIAEKFFVPEDKVNKYFQVLKLPQSVQRLVGKGKLWITHAYVLTSLLGTPYEKMIDRLAREDVEQDWALGKLRGRVNAIKHGKTFTDDAICTGCKKVFPFSSMNKPIYCQECMAIVGEKVSSRISEKAVKKHKEAKKECHRLVAIVDNLDKAGKKIPDSVFEYLDKLRET